MKEKKDYDGSMSLDDLYKRSIAAGQIRNPQQVVSDLKQAFSRDFTVEEACHYAGIKKDTYYRWLKESDEFAEAMEVARSFAFRKSKEVILDKIQNEKDADLAKWYLERRQKDRYSSRVETTGRDGGSLDINISNYTSEELDKMTDDELLRATQEQIRGSQASQ